MSRKRTSNPPHKKIIEAQEDIWSQCPNARCDPAEYCWGCGICDEPGWQERAHIVAHEDGGTTEPTNFFLLCHVCHKEQPSRLSRELQIEWLKNRMRYEDRIMALHGSKIVEITQIMAGFGWNQFERTEVFQQMELMMLEIQNGCHSDRATLDTAFILVKSQLLDGSLAPTVEGQSKLEAYAKEFSSSVERAIARIREKQAQGQAA